MDVSEDIQRTLGRLEEKLDTLLTYRQEQQAEIDALAQRVSRLESWRMWLVGFCAGVIGVVSTLATIAWKTISLLAKQ